MMRILNRKYALIAGWSIILMAFVAGYSYGYVFNAMVDETDWQMTCMRISSNQGIYLSGIAGWVLIIVLDVVVGWSLWRFFSATNEMTAGLVGLSRLVYASILTLAIYYLHQSYYMASSLALMDLHGVICAFQKVWSMGLILFGIHLLGLALLVFQSTYVPKVFGFLLILAGLGYLIVHMGRNAGLSSELINQLELLFSLPMMIGEVGFAVWLVVKGGKNIQVLSLHS